MPRSAEMAVRHDIDRDDCPQREALTAQHCVPYSMSQTVDDTQYRRPDMRNPSRPDLEDPERRRPVIPRPVVPGIFQGWGIRL